MKAKNVLENVIDVGRYRLGAQHFREQCKRTLDRTGVLVLPEFMQGEAVSTVQREGKENQHAAYFTVDDHNIYLTEPDGDYAPDHPRNRQVSSSKGCITDDQVPAESPLRTLYDAAEFREFLCSVLNESELHEYADLLSSINLHYASEGQELGWHYDNSSFAITLLIQVPEAGGEFEYVKDVRDADAGEMNYALSGRVLDGDVETEKLSMDPGALVLFRGRNSMHRVTPVVGNRTRMLVVLAYNSKPGIQLSESARMTFYGRLQ